MTLKAVGGLLEAPSRGVKRGIEKGFDMAGSRRPERQMAAKWQGELVDGLRDLSENVVNNPQVREFPELLAVARDTLDALSRPLLRNEEVRKVMKQINRTEVSMDLEELAVRSNDHRLMDLAEQLDEYLIEMERGLPKAPDVGAKFMGFSPTAAPEISMAGAAMGIGGAPMQGMAAVGAAGFIGKGVRNVGLALMRDPTGETIRGMIARAPHHIQQKLGPILAKVGNERGYKAAIFVAMHDPIVRQWIRSDLGGEEPDESIRRVPAARTGR